MKPVIGVPIKTSSYRPRYKRRWRRRRYTRGPTTRRPRYRSRWNQNLSTRAMWFKKCGDLGLTGDGIVNDIITANDSFPIPSFVNECRSWEQYKVLRVVVKYYPAYVGSESVTQSLGGYRRGNVVTWIEQPPFNAPNPNAGSISVLMGYPSAKLHQPRSTIKRWMNRPSGGRYLPWSFITHPTALGLPTIAPDTWDTQLRLFGDGFSAATAGPQRPYFFYEALFKVVFRSRYRGGPPDP